MQSFDLSTTGQELGSALSEIAKTSRSTFGILKAITKAADIRLATLRT